MVRASAVHVFRRVPTLYQHNVSYQQCVLMLEAARHTLPKDLLDQLGGTMGDSTSPSGRPLADRKALAEVRQLDLRLAREKARLEDMELNTSHLLSTAFRELKVAAELSQTHLIRVDTAKEKVETAISLLQCGKITVDLVLDGQRRRAQAEKDYYRAVGEHAIALGHQFSDWNIA